MILKIVSVALSLTSISLFVAPSASAGWIESIKSKVNNSGIDIKGTYAPPKLPFSVNCDLNGNGYISFSPGVSTPLGRFGINATRKIKSFNCRGRSK